VLVFIGRRDKARLPVWDRHGLWALYARLERGRDGGRLRTFMLRSAWRRRVPDTAS
jgi:hypothetical protein